MSRTSEDAKEPAVSEDHVYLSLAEGHEDDSRWAYGTGFEDPLHGVDTAVPDTTISAGPSFTR